MVGWAKQSFGMHSVTWQARSDEWNSPVFASAHLAQALYREFKDHTGPTYRIAWGNRKRK
jgi:hypothetical protein